MKRILLLLLLCLTLLSCQPTNSPQTMNSTLPLLSDPFLQNPTKTSISVVWFTEFPGIYHQVLYGNKLKQKITAHTTKLSRVREDRQSKTAFKYSRTTLRNIWRHEAIITNLSPNERVSYQVISTSKTGEKGMSKIFTLAPQPQPETSLKILLTSDHQLKPMTAVNLQKVVETIGQIDAVFLAGDLVNVPDRASEWFDDSRGGAFFPCLQGNGNYVLEKEGQTTVYQGGEIIQHAPLYPAIGNHEVMGRFSMDTLLNQQFNDPFPSAMAEVFYQAEASQINLRQDPEVREAWIKANSFNSDTYEEIFTLPNTLTGKEHYYAVTFGDIRLVVLEAANIWRSPRRSPEVRGKYQEREQDYEQSQNWGYGQHIFEAISQGSLQYNWLEKELKSEAFQQAPYKIVMLHYPLHSLGDNIVPPYTDPIPRINYNPDGTIRSLRYEYPKDQDYLIRDVIPLLESAGVQLVYYGHSHLWNRFESSGGMHFLESSNVGNTYGAYLGEKKRPIPKDLTLDNYVSTGDPNGLTPIVPTVAPLLDEKQNPLPYIASNDLTVFTIFETENQTVSSYYFDTRDPKSEVVLFDQFQLQ